MPNKVINVWDWDVRVRERNLRQGRVTDKDVEKMLTALPDLATASDPVAVPQPAVAGREDASGSSPS